MLGCHAFVLLIFPFIIHWCHSQSETTTNQIGTTEAESATVKSVLSTLALLEPLSETTTVSTNEILDHPRDGYIDMEIISIEVVASEGNVVELSWGKPIRGYNLDWTYGVYYGKSAEDALQGPKLTTTDLYAVVKNLTFCSQYIFAVGVVDSSRKIGHPPRNIRMIGTLIDVRSSPENLRIDFIPDQDPCLLIQWSASCPNIIVPLGYSVTVFERNPSRMMIITERQSTATDLSQTLRVIYGKSYNIKVSTDIAGSNSTAIVSYKVPLFLQPYKVRLSAQPDGSFIMYWREPYVPYHVGPFFYEVYVYPGRGVKGHYTLFQTNKPAFVFQGNQTEYTFMVGLRSADGAFKSSLSDPVAKSLFGEAVVLSVD